MKTLLNSQNQIAQFIRFCIIGALNSAVSFVSYYLLIKLTVPMGISYVISYILGMITSLTLNSKWTFATKFHWSIAGKFVVANLIVVIIGEQLLSLIVRGLHFPVAYAQLVTLVPTTVINFVISRYWVYIAKNSKSAEGLGENTIAVRGK